MKAQAEVGILHDGQLLSKAPYRVEVHCPTEQGLISKQAPQAPTSKHHGSKLSPATQL